MATESAEQVNILLVDDQPPKLLAYEAMLSSLGVRLLRAQSGTQAFEVLLQEEIAVILLDVNMPGLDGFETAAMIREHPRFVKTPIIFVTAVNTTDLDRIRGYEIGAVDYVSVPVIPEILRAKVSVFVELHRKRRELERANQSLFENEQRMRAILETANDAIITIDSTGVILTANPAAELIFGYHEEELIGKSAKVLMTAPWRREFEEALNSGASGTLASLSREIQGLRKGGSGVPLEVAVSEAMPGKIYTAIIRDITRRKQLEREVTEIAAAEQRRIGQALHDGVSQELTGLTMMANALKERVVRDLPAAGALANRVVEALGNVHNQVRDVSHGLIPVEVDAEGLRAALEDLVERIRRQASIVCDIHCAEPVFVRDALTATNLYHIVQEAINNALRHGRASRIDIHVEARADALEITVSDDGVGMPVELPIRNGVGIRLMRYRAGLIGGVLQIRPARSKGTAVSCTLPDWCRTNGKYNGDENNFASKSPAEMV